MYNIGVIDSADKLARQNQGVSPELTKVVTIELGVSAQNRNTGMPC